MFEIVHVDTCTVMFAYDNLRIAQAETDRLNAQGGDCVLCFAGGFLVPDWH